MKRLFLLILIPISYILTVIASFFPSFTEKFLSLGIYKIYSQIVSSILGLFPFSIAEILLIGGILTIIGTLGFSIYKSIRFKNFKSLINYLKNMAVAVSLVYFIFTISCGVNYYRYNFEYYYTQQNEITKTEYTAQDLEELCTYLVKTGAEISNELTQEDVNFSVYDLSKQSRETFKKLSDEYEVFSANYSSPKPIYWSNLMSYTNILGFFFPFTIESNVNVDVVDYQIPFTMLHEQAHQYGFMREDEANFLAYLSGKSSQYNFVRYSCYMQASVYAMNSLYDVDYDAFCRVYEFYSDKQLDDKKENYEYWKQFEGEVSQTFTQVNDSYLKANGQEDGVISYSKVTELLLMDYFSEYR